MENFMAGKRDSAILESRQVESTFGIYMFQRENHGVFQRREERLDRMNRKEIGNTDILFLLKCLLLSYLLTGACLMILALLLYKLRLSEQIVSIAIIIIYVEAVFLAGFLAGKRMKSRKFLWGLALGLAYFGVMVLVSLAVNHSLKGLDTHFFSTLTICAAGGMLGGMLS